MNFKYRLAAFTMMLPLFIPIVAYPEERSLLEATNNVEKQLTVQTPTIFANKWLQVFGGINYDPSLEGCGAYDTQFKTCCDGKLSSPGGQSCCGTQAYDTQFETCCDGKLSSPGGQSCG